MFWQLLPEQLASIQHFPTAHVEDVDRKHAVFQVIAKNIGVVALEQRHALALLHQLNGRNQIAVFGSFFKALFAGSLLHSLTQRFVQVPYPTVEQKLDVFDGFRIPLRCGQPLHARPQASLDVKLQTWTRMRTTEINGARRDQKMTVDEIDEPVSQTGGKIRSKIQAAIALQPAGDVDPRVAFAHRELNVGVSFVIAQQDVEARLLLLDQIILKRQSFLVVIDYDVIDIDRLAQQAASLGIAKIACKIRTHTGPQVLRLAHVDDFSFGVLVQIHARQER